MSGGERSWKTVARKLRNELYMARLNTLTAFYGTLAVTVEQAAKITGTVPDSVCKKYPDGWSSAGKGKVIDLAILMDQYTLAMGLNFLPEK